MAASALKGSQTQAFGQFNPKVTTIKKLFATQNWKWKYFGMITFSFFVNLEVLTYFFNLLFEKIIITNDTFFSWHITGVYPCICNSSNLSAPDTQIKNTNGRALFKTCVTSWVGKGGVGITCFPNINERLIRRVNY